MRGKHLSVALSGGGLRASLYGFGALLYLSHAGLNRDVKTISSVSGGSITNAWIGMSCQYSEVSPERFDEIVAKFCTKVRRGLILPRIILLALILPLFLVLATLVALGPRYWYLAPIPIIVGSAALLLRGTLIAIWFRHSLFRRESSDPLRLEHIRGSVEHVFCATDLNGSAPIAISTAADGLIVSGVWGWGRANRMWVADAVRASAAFPGGIPPKRLRLPKMTHPSAAWKEANEVFEWRGKPPTLFLADGGIWNNLGTDYFLNNDVWGVLHKSPARPRMRSSSDPLIVVDAGAPRRRRRLRYLNVPGVAELAAAFTVARVQYGSTLLPRVEQLRLSTSIGLSNHFYPLVQSPLIAQIRMEEGSWRELIHLTMVDNPTSKQGIVDPGAAGAIGARAQSLKDNYGIGYGVKCILQSESPVGSGTVGESIRSQRRFPRRAWNMTLGHLSSVNGRVPTTLFRLNARTTFMLLLQGYLDTRDITHAYLGAEQLAPDFRRIANIAGCSVSFVDAHGDAPLVGTVH